MSSSSSLCFSILEELVLFQRTYVCTFAATKKVKDIASHCLWNELFGIEFFNLCALSPRKFTFYRTIWIHSILYSGDSLAIHSKKTLWKLIKAQNRMRIIATVCCHVVIAQSDYKLRKKVVSFSTNPNDDLSLSSWPHDMIISWTFTFFRRNCHWWRKV